MVGHVSMYPNAQAHRSYDIDMSYGVRPSGRPDAPIKAQQSWAFDGVSLLPILVRAWARVVLAQSGGSRLRWQYCPVGRDRSRLAVDALPR